MVLSAAFHPDGTRAVASSPEAPVYVWDVLGAPGRWDPAKADAVWADLGSEDAKIAYAAVRKLRANPGQAVAFLREHVKPAAVPSEEAVKGWLKGLDSPVFAVRQEAHKALTAAPDLPAPGSGAEGGIRRDDAAPRAGVELDPDADARAAAAAQGVRSPGRDRHRRGGGSAAGVGRRPGRGVADR
jgi:hypothetical protein